MLVNGAGVNSASPYVDVTDDDWNWVLANNLTGVHLGCQIFGRDLEPVEGVRVAVHVV